jgi:hypothetical protein
MLTLDFWTPLLAFIGASVGGIIAFFGQREGKRLRQAKNNITFLSNQASSLYELEKYYLGQLHNKNPDVSTETFKRNGRKWVVNQGLQRIEITSGKAQIMKRKWDKPDS